jgi:1-acyl-sn-glycerol-3-phosphate acyltransferase
MLFSWRAIWREGFLMLGPLFRLTLLALWGLFLAPLQWLSVKFNLKSQRSIPLLFHQTGLKLLGVKVILAGAPAIERPLLVCSSHVSWLDIPVLSSLFPVSFVSRADVARWPVFGTLARLQRSIFIDRTRRGATHRAIQSIAKRLDAGDAIVIFPEGTTSNGNSVLPFRSSLLGTAQHAMQARGAGGEIFIQPVCIHYCGMHGLPMGRSHQPFAAWYGDMDLVPHLLDLLKLGPIEVRVSFGALLSFSGADDRKEIAKIAQRAVRDLREASSCFSNLSAAARRGTRKGRVSAT